jgi:hypothetical protein
MVIVFSNNLEIDSKIIETASFYERERRLFLLLKNGDHLDVLPATDWDLTSLERLGVRVFHKVQRIRE